MEKWQYSKGLHEVGDGVYAYLQPDGSWGWSNAGLVAVGAQSLLVDTLFDLPLTREMLAAMERVTSQRPISHLVNTHANGDHCWGNQLVSGAEIIASRACRDEMMEFSPAMLEMFVQADGLGRLGEYARACFGSFDFGDITVTPPTRVFEGSLRLDLDGRPIELIEVGPAHTRGDVLVYLPDQRTIFTGDILFIDGTPIMWAGPVGNWIGACDRMLAMDLDVVVPGHGPVTDKRGIAAVRDYLVYVRDQARTRYDAGMSVEDATRDIALGDFSAWGDAERIAVNVDTLFREFRGDSSPPDAATLFSRMAALA
jgi:cyclase